MSCPIRTAWETRVAAGEPRAAVRIDKLQHHLQAGLDAWGRANRTQPILVSAEVLLAQPFPKSVQVDDISADTIHYGLLAKAILRCLTSVNVKQLYALRALDPTYGHSAAPPTEKQDPLTLRDVLDLVWAQLTGMTLGGQPVRLPLPRGDTKVDGEKTAVEDPFLAVEAFRYLSLTLELPKASLTGESVFLTGAMAFGERGAPLCHSVTVGVRALRLPVLIGLNANERRAKQLVVAHVDVDRCDVRDDVYPKLERTVSDALLASDLQTLEALAALVLDRLQTAFRPVSAHHGLRFRIALEKPIAVPSASCPCVELYSA